MLNRCLVLMLICAVPKFVSADEPCRLGSDKWVVACDQLQVTAQWDQTLSQDCTYNPPPGYAISETKVDVNSSNSGSRSVSLIAGGSKFATESDFEAARNALTAYAAKSQNKDYSGSINSQINNRIRASREFSASNNTVYATVQASGSGNWLDKKRGWENITVRAHLLCLGVPSVDVLVSQLRDQIGIKVPLPVWVKHNCPKGMMMLFQYVDPKGVMREDKVKYDKPYDGPIITETKTFGWNESSNSPILNRKTTEIATEVPDFYVFSAGFGENEKSWTLTGKPDNPKDKLRKKDASGTSYWKWQPLRKVANQTRWQISFSCPSS